MTRNCQRKKSMQKANERARQDELQCGTKSSKLLNLWINLTVMNINLCRPFHSLLPNLICPLASMTFLYRSHNTLYAHFEFISLIFAIICFLFSRWIFSVRKIIINYSHVSSFPFSWQSRKRFIVARAKLLNELTKEMWTNCVTCHFIRRRCCRQQCK